MREFKTKTIDMIFYNNRHNNEKRRNKNNALKKTIQSDKLQQQRRKKSREIKLEGFTEEESGFHVLHGVRQTSL